MNHDVWNTTDDDVDDVFKVDLDDSDTSSNQYDTQNPNFISLVHNPRKFLQENTYST